MKIFTLPSINPNRFGFIVLVAFMAACSDFENDPQLSAGEDGFLTLMSNGDGPLVFPDIYEASDEYRGGNVRCDQLPVTYSGPGSQRVDYESGEFQGAFPEGFSVSTDGTKVSWTFTPFVDEDGIKQCLGGISVIVKGGNAANVYTYEEGFFDDKDFVGDSGLVSPDNASDGPAELSNLTICYNLVPCPDEEEEPCYKEETAWADGTRYVNQGNWATYTEYVPGAEVTIYAGQTHEVGTATFEEENGEVKITIALSGARFQDVAENLKIQDYDEAPSGNPAPGGFDHKFDIENNGPFTVTVPLNNFYGIHLDVEREVECPDEEEE